jgi:hypothetical protein
VTLTASADPGSTFTGWSGDLTGSASPETIAMSASRSLTADFADLPDCADGLDNDGDGGTDSDGAPPDPECNQPWQLREDPRRARCGTGLELALALPALGWLHGRRRGAGGPRPHRRPTARAKV